jgi:hypothetical protein
MFQFHRTNQLQAPRFFNHWTSLVRVAMTVVSLWVAAAPGWASRSTAILRPATQTPAASQAPKTFAEAVVEVTQRDFGDVFAGEELEHSFQVRNAGTKPLLLEEKSSLGTRPVAPNYPVTAAFRRTGDGLFPRSVAAKPVAPT